jgi:hypothetical protein
MYFLTLVEFNIHTIITLEKLLGAGSFGCSIGHLAHSETTFLASLRGFSFPFIVWNVSLTILGCWALIALAFVICF